MGNARPTTFSVERLLGVALVLLVAGLFVANSGTRTLRVCSSIGPYRLIAADLRFVSYVDGCNGVRVATVELLPLAVAGVVLFTAVGLPTRDRFAHLADRRRSSVLLVIVWLVLLVAGYLHFLPLTLALAAIVITAVLRAVW